MRRKTKILAVAVGLGLLVVGLFGGGVLAQTPTPTPPNAGDYSCHGAFGAGDQVTLNRVADVLGISPTDLSNELAAGKTLAQIAQSKGVPEDAVVTTILAPRKDMLAVLVRYGYLTQEQADQMYQRMAEITKQVINATGWGAGTGYGHGGMMGGTGYGSGGMMGGSGYGSGMMGGYGTGGMMRGRGRTL